MRVEVTRDQSQETTFVEIHCREITNDVERLRKYISDFGMGIKAFEGGETHIVTLDKILYIESVDKKTFIYTKNKVFATDKRLYELEDLLDKRDFFRCSKSVIINLNKVTKLRPEITRNILATLDNGEVIVVSRRYATELKKLLKIGE